MKATRPNKTQIKSWMSANKAAHIDRCNEVDCTGLAEAAAYHFDAVSDDGTIGDVYYDAAAELATVAQ